jgi:hypothetical protein
MWDNNEKKRKRWGRDVYRIVKNDYFESGMIKSTTYSIEQQCYIPIFGLNWIKVEHEVCGMGDCYWMVIYYHHLDQAEQAVRLLRNGDKWNGHKETIIKHL